MKTTELNCRTGRTKGPKNNEIEIVRNKVHENHFFMKLLIKNNFTMFSIKIIKKMLRNCFFLLNCLIKNVFATFFVKIIKKHFKM